MARYPSAEWAPILWMNRLTHHRKTQLTFHITAGEGDPRTIQSWRDGSAGSNLVVFRDGRAVQNADSLCKSAADAGATHTISIEFVGANGPLTDAQVQTAIRLARDANRLDGVPLRLAATSSDAGIGWHRLGVDGNFPKGRMGGRLQRSPLGVKTSSAFGKLCPTDSVINQIHDVILPALTQEEDFMSELSAAEQRQMYNALVGPNGSAAMKKLMPFGQNIPTSIAKTREGLQSLLDDLKPVERLVDGRVVKIPLRQEVADTKTALAAQAGQIAGLTAALGQISSGTVDLDAIREASRQGVADALASVETTVTVKKG